MNNYIKIVESPVYRAIEALQATHYDEQLSSKAKNDYHRSKYGYLSMILSRPRAMKLRYISDNMIKYRENVDKSIWDLALSIINDPVWEYHNKDLKKCDNVVHPSGMKFLLTSERDRICAFDLDVYNLDERMVINYAIRIFIRDVLDKREVLDNIQKEINRGIALKNIKENLEK